MPLKESEAIVLHSMPLGEADRLVSFLSRTEGRLKGVARGARRVKSQFGSTLEPLSYIRIWFYERESRELVRINQCELLESFYEAQRDYSTGIALALISEIVELVLPEHEATDPMFRLVLMVSREIALGKEVWLSLAYFAIWTVRLSGWLPSFARCQNCGGEFGQRGAYMMMNGEMVCINCRIGGRHIPAGVLETGRKMLEVKLPSLTEAGMDVSSVKVLLDEMLDIVERQAERKLASRKMWAEQIEI
jgi:DNA repair protein RecO (recombination protein O)